jgi:hypothetical protein
VDVQRSTRHSPAVVVSVVLGPTVSLLVVVLSIAVVVLVVLVDVVKGH